MDLTSDITNNRRFPLACARSNLRLATHGYAPTGSCSSISHHAVGAGPFHVVHPTTVRRQPPPPRSRKCWARRGIRGSGLLRKEGEQGGLLADPPAADLDAGVDVASEPELVHALALRCPRPRDIGVTGAAKTDALLRLAAAPSTVSSAIDALDELECGSASSPRSGGRLRILLRRSARRTHRHSRFGLGGRRSRTKPCVRCAELRELKPRLAGFSFHLDGYEWRAEGRNRRAS